MELTERHLKREYLSMTKISALVIAGNYQQYRDWLKEVGQCSLDYKFVIVPKDVYGYHDIPIFLIGEYWKNPNIYKIAQIVQGYK